MQAIETKFLAPSNVRGSRIKATCERGSITIDCDPSLRDEERHIAAAKALCEKFTKEDEKRYGSTREQNPWLRPFVTGGLKNSYVHVFTT